ncbi:MAG: UDP-glucose 4-epimerase GalE [Candidatus Latescibacteria bacterium]|nr:UDP-glucose 4-epimerase GalE [bacterium]MBD3423139.1 UDP-glucose 4-epimerase GalE [Candidatus Latescibacterota bacterium]
MKVLVTGGAGYIGSVVAEYLIEEGYEVVIADDLSTGHRDAVDRRASFVELSLLDGESVRHILSDGIGAVLHFAAFSLVSESMKDPLKYYRNNICGAVNLVNGMVESGVKNIVFSSTAAVYGEPEGVPITEDSRLLPVNPYGKTKLAIEALLEDARPAYGIKSISLRYFNAAGATDLHGEDHRPESHLIPIILDAAEGRRDKLTVYGGDYNTGDGTCVRDYIHVRDLAAAHILALRKLEEGITGPFNLGSGNGFSVLEVIRAASDVTGTRVPYSIGERREGDPAVLIASSEKAQKVLGWKRTHTGIEDIIRDAYRWRGKYPGGYTD